MGISQRWGRKQRDALAAEVDGLRRDITALNKPAADQKRDFDESVPLGMRVAAAWAWRIALLAAVAIGIGWVLSYLSQVSIPVAIAILLAAGLTPLVRMFRKWGLPRALATALTLLIGLLVIGGTFTLIGAQAVNQADDLANKTMEALRAFTGWLERGPLHITADRLNHYLDLLTQQLRQSQAEIARYAAGAGSAIGNFITGSVMALFALFFFLLNGRQIWTFLLKMVPRAGRERTDQAARRGWESLVAYVRATVAVAAFDALWPLVAALIMGVPMAWALGAMIFIASFIPIVGLIVAGFIATAVTLVTLGPIQALIMLGVIVIANQIESNILQPFLLGRAVALHPLAVLLGIAVGIIISGIVGALLVIPIMAFAKTFVGFLTDEEAETPPAPPGSQVATGDV